MLLGLGAVSPSAFGVQNDSEGGISAWAGGSTGQTLGSAVLRAVLADFI